MNPLRQVVHAWLVLDFFGEARRTGSPGSSLTTTIFTQSFLALVVAGLMYPETPPVPFAAANLCLSTLLVATGMLNEHDQLTRRRADHLLLATAPRSRAFRSLAQATHAAFYLGLVTIGMALPPAILLGLWTGSALQSLAYVGMACLCSGLAAAALAVATRLVERSLGPIRAALFAGTTRAVLLGAGLVGFALSLQRLGGNADGLPITRLGAELLPPYHAARLLAYPDEFWRWGALGGAAAVLWLLALIANDHDKEPGSVRQPRSWLLPLLRRLCGEGPRLGVAAFTATMMWRSPGFRARVLPLLGLPAGMVVLSLPSDGSQPSLVFLCLLLQLPAIYLPFLIAFLPRADQPGTDWIFAQAPALPTAVVRDGVWRALITHVLVPVHLIGMGMLVVTGGPLADMVAASLFALALGTLMARVMLRNLAEMPFSQSRDESAGIDLGGLFALALVLGALGAGFGALAATWQRWLAASIALGIAGGQLLRRGHATTAAADPDAQTAATEASVNLTQVSVDKADADEPVDAGPPPANGLARELRAIVVLYAACSALPLLVGLALAG
jgi:hypothetical protein